MAIFDVGMKGVVLCCNFCLVPLYVAEMNGAAIAVVYDASPSQLAFVLGCNGPRYGFRAGTTRLRTGLGR